MIYDSTSCSNVTIDRSNIRNLSENYKKVLTNVGFHELALSIRALHLAVEQFIDRSSVLRSFHSIIAENVTHRYLIVNATSNLLIKSD